MKLVVNGREAYAYTGGKPFDAAKPCVAFVHGALLDHGVWTLLARWCANHGYAAVAVDLPGHMRSEGPALTSVEAMADWLLAALDAAGVRRAVLVGHSMGSLIALEAAARAPERASALVMMGTAVPMKVSKLLLDTSRDAPLKAIDLVVTFSHSTLAPKPSYPGPGIWVRGGARALGRQVLAHQGDALLYHTDFVACDAYANGLAAAAKVRCPATLVLGAADQMTLPKAAQEVARALKATVHTVPAGHMLMQEAPEETLVALRAALAGIRHESAGTPAA
jgi:pimeloyl-ACP methyl ester carboxylesterase